MAEEHSPRWAFQTQRPIRPARASGSALLQHGSGNIVEYERVALGSIAQHKSAWSACRSLEKALARAAHYSVAVMAGTYLQQDVYGTIAGATPLFNAASMSDHQLVELVHSHPAAGGEEALRLGGRNIALPAQGCGAQAAADEYDRVLARICRSRGAGRRKFRLDKSAAVLFNSYERNENIFKVILPAVLRGQPLVYINHALPQARCLALPHMIRGKELQKGSANTPHLLASRIPGWSGRAVLVGHLEMTKGYLDRRNATADLADYAEQLARMERQSFNTSRRLPVTDTLWMIWPTGDEIAEKMSRLWLHEVARFSSYEKVSYPWVVSQVPDFKAYLTDAVYIYSPEQRCGWNGSSSSGGGGGGKKKKSKKRGLRRNA